MARATAAGVYSRNSLGLVIAFGIAVSMILGRFVIPIYYVLGERLRARGTQPTPSHEARTFAPPSPTEPATRPNR
jgi:HAE1 family hydrophobic/amphiphilic exporter-1